MITCIGDLVVDVIVQHDAVQFATDSDANIQTRAGGQANNVAAWVANRGVHSHLIGRVGKDPFGDYLCREATSQGIDCSVVIDPTDKTGMIVLLIDSTGERSMLVDRGANLKLVPPDLTKLEQSKLLYISGYSLFSENPQKTAFEAIHIAKAHAIPIAVDPSSTYFLQDHADTFLNWMVGATFFIPNYEEAVLITGLEDPKRILHFLRDVVPYPIIKLGKQGCMLLNETRECIQIPAPSVEAVDTTGAGDAFMGTFLATFYQTQDIVASTKKAVEVGSKVVMQVGARPVLKNGI